MIPKTIDGAGLTAHHEGFREDFYYDSLGYVTGGYGCLCDPRKGAKLPQHIWKIIFDYQYAKHEEELRKLQPWITQMGKDNMVRYYVLVDMAFNLGTEPFDGDGFKDWPIFLRQVKEGNYLAAAANMRSTLWYKQVGQRGERLARMMESGEWPGM